MNGEKQVALIPVVDELPAAAEVSMFERLALDPNANVEKLEKLVEMQKWVMRHNAEAAFNRSFADMQGEIPTVIERAKTNNGTYAPLEDIQDAVRPILQRHGFSLSFRTEWPDKSTVKVIGILTHSQGHKRESEFLSGADSSGNKNAIQGLGSAVTYGRRYTTKDLLNITTRGADDDGARTGRPDPPEGFDKYWQQLSEAAGKGTTALEAAWACSADEPYKSYRQYIARHGASELSALRVRAKKVRA